MLWQSVHDVEVKERLNVHSATEKDKKMVVLELVNMNANIVVELVTKHVQTAKERGTVSI